MNIRVDDHILLRSYQPEDAAELFRCVQANRVHLREFLPWVDLTVQEADSTTFINITLEQAREQRGLALGIFLDGMLAGGIGLHEWNHPLRKCQIGYWLAERFEGRGLMYRCAVAFLDFIFLQLELNKVEIHFIPANLRSGALAERLGARIEGVLRDNCRIHGAFEDTVVAGILAGEWKARPEASTAP